jgi:glyoxylase-like metal-dependent hydrolase (beta-lactamase superfamily II)
VSELALYLFSSGTLEVGGVEVPVPFFLVRHPAGDVVIDGGNPLAVARDPRAHWGALAEVFHVRMSETQHCVAQLRELGIERDSVRYVVQTHLHIDHTGALGHFSGAPVVVHARELEAARSTEAPRARGYVPADFEHDGLEWRCVEHDLDLFGDGTLQLLQTPGHSAGHMSVLIKLPATGSVLLTADAVDTRAQWERRLPLRVLYSPEDAERSLEQLRRLADEMRALVIFGHDSENWSQLQHAPDVYS